MRSTFVFQFVLFSLAFIVVQNAKPIEVPISQAIVTNQEPTQKLKLGVVGLVHTHVHWILGRPAGDDIKIVGIVEPNRELAQRYSKQHGFPMEIVFDSIEEMVEARKPEAVTAFNTIYDHLKVVEFCAPRGIHVMVEKPLAVSLDHARQMKRLAKKHGIHLLTNYETSWYPTTRETYRLAKTNKHFSSINKINFYTGHQGPIEIGCNQEFVEWLIDPKQNGGGALTDFGCYGANLATWILQGETPTSVMCVTRKTKPEKYPDVEDDATIVLNYSKTQVLIQASWNWSHNRKEMELFGNSGYIKCLNGTEMSVMLDEKAEPESKKLDDENHDPFNLFQKVVKANLKLKKYDVSALDNNYLVMQILEAAKIAARENRVFYWDEFSK